MESSKFLQLSNNILVEYVYTSQANPTTFNTATHPIEILRNGYTNDVNLFSINSDIGNFRGTSAVPINRNRTKYARLNPTTIGIPYNDTDPNLSNSSELSQSFSPELDVEYDTIRFHFTSGFNFIDFDGIIFEISTISRNGNNAVLSSLNFLRTDTPIFNPDPFLLGDRLYATYIEWKIPSLFFANKRFQDSLPADRENTVAARLTLNKGFQGTPTIRIRALGILNTTTTGGYDFYSVNEINSLNITSRDLYDNLSAQVIESQSGDFFELTGVVEGNTLSNFISILNSTSSGNYVLFHDITLSEQIGTTFVQTGNQLITQTSNFDEPVFYRPIVLNSANAISFSINYVLRLYNRADNTQIIKNARFTSFNVKKYGRRLMKINLGVVPTVANIVNQIDPTDGRNIIISPKSFNINNNETILTKTKFVTSFRDRHNIKAAISPVKIQNVIG